MNTTLFTLPDDFGIGSCDSLIHFYSNNKSSVNNKVVFTKNMFCLLQQGIKEVHTAEEKTTISANELLILTSGSVLMSETVTENNTYEAILIFFGNKTLTDFCIRQAFSLNKKASSRSVLKIERDDFLNNYCHSLKLLRKENNTAINELKVQEILGYISAKYPEEFQLLVSQALTDNAAIKLKQVVQLNIHNGLTVEELAFLCNMSMSTFKRYFAEIYQLSPQKYFTQLKMKQAELLLSLQKRPSDIYTELGYENLSAFSSEFKKHFGVSPRHFQFKKNC